jgi:eukaryotic-like serine/threonine-protein kinase
MPISFEDHRDPDESLLEHLLAWQEARANGHTPPVEELCPDDPVGQARLRAWIAAVSGFDAFAGDEANRATAEPQSITCSVNLDVLRFHASGGLGEVYVARDDKLNREVALKRIKAGADRPASRSRFLLEAEVTGGLEHPGVVPVYGVGHDADGRPYYAMRFIRGDSLKDAIEQFHRADGQPNRDPGERALALRQLLRRFVDVCNAVAYAHSRGVLHRDLKPANVMLGPYGETLVVDWGLAKVVGRADGAGTSVETVLQPSSGSGEAPTRTGSALGTPTFMSPEQAAGRLDDLGPASDVYSLGAMLYNLLAGRPPFVDAERAELLRKVKAGEFPPPRRVNGIVPQALEAVCLKAMAKESSGRYPSPRALADEIDHWLADEPVGAWREPISARAGRWMRRHRTAMTGAAAAVLAGLIGLSAVAGVQARSNRELKKAKGETEVALATSEEARRRAEAVLGFLKNDVLAAARPEGQEGGLGVEVTVRKAVDAAEPKIAEAFKDQPLVEAEVRETLGLTYSYLGEPPLAIPQFERAVELYRAHLDPEHRDTLSSRDHLAEAYRAAGRTNEAIRLHEATLQAQEKTLGRDHPDTLASRNNLAEAYRTAGRFAEVIPLLDETLRMQETKLGPDHPNTLVSRNNFAKAHLDAGHTDEAIRLLTEVVKVQETKVGPSHPDTLNSRNSLAVAYQKAGRYDEAIALHEATLRLKESKLGPAHPSTLASRNNLAIAYEKAGRQTDAIALDEVTLKLREAQLGPDHPDTINSRIGLGSAYYSTGRYTEAIALGETTLKLSESKLGPEHPLTLASRNNLAASYVGVGRFTEAIELHEGTLKLCEAHLERDHPNTLRCRANLANTYQDAGRIAEAIELDETTIKLREAKLRPDHPDTLVSRNNLANSYMIAGRLSKSISLLEPTSEMFVAKLGPDHPYALGTRNNLARAYESIGRWAEAETLRRDTLSRRRKTSKPDSPLLALDLDSFGGYLLGQSRWSEAELLLRESLAIRQKATPDWRRYHAMSLLGGALLGQSRYPEAEPLIVPGYEGMKDLEARIRFRERSSLREAAERVVHLYEAWSKPEQAAAWKAKLGMPDLAADVFAPASRH